MNINNTKKFLIGILFLIFSGLLLSSGRADAASGDYVVLLHGIGRTKITMTPLDGYLSWKEYNVINIDYQSRQKAIEDIIEDIHAIIAEKKIDPIKPIHFVGYSLGGLVIRAYLNEHRPKNLGRVVMIGTPNQGSEVADFLSDYSFYQEHFGPAGLQLTTDQKKIKEILGKVDYDLGVIAGKMSIDPISSLLLIPGSDDGKVSIESTKLNGMKDHIVLSATHTFMLNNPFVMSQVLHFIENGRFEHEEKEEIKYNQ